MLIIFLELISIMILPENVYLFCLFLHIHTNSILNCLDQSQGRRVVIRMYAVLHDVWADPFSTHNSSINEAERDHQPSVQVSLLLVNYRHTSLIFSYISESSLMTFTTRNYARSCSGVLNATPNSGRPWSSFYKVDHVRTFLRIFYLKPQYT